MNPTSTSRSPALLNIVVGVYLPGFPEPADFSRAFKRWTKTTPNIYRSTRPLPAAARFDSINRESVSGANLIQFRKQATLKT